MANEQNLIPLNLRTKKRQREITSMGGKVISEKKKRAAKLREIRKRIEKGLLNDGDEQYLLDRIEDPNVMDLDMLSFFDSIREDVHPNQRVALLNAYTQLKKSIHGEKIKTENVHHIINWGEMLGGEVEISEKAKKFDGKDSIDV